MNMTLFLFALFAACLPQDRPENVDFYAGRSPGLDSLQISQGWLSLFDGKSLFGWRQESSANWEAKDDAIVVSSGEPGLLRTGVQFDDFELQLEFKSATDARSGVFIRTSPRPDAAAGGCIAVNIAPSTDPFPTGSIVGFDKSQAIELNTGFNAMTILAVGNQVVVDINGKRVSQTTTDQVPKKGYIGLQHHSGEVQFRNISVRPLKLDSMLNGKDLSGWSRQQQLDSRFSFRDGALHVISGKGQIEFENQHADFVFFSHIRTNAEGLNSGVFFRCIPGELMNGYESQIQNEFAGHDRTKPKDHGTGGIFRRAPARIVNSSDKSWFAKTIIADGATIWVWVNGLLVTDWTDTRKPHPNPRKGRRLQQGTIILQGHDPATDLSFRDMRIRELRRRR